MKLIYTFLGGMKYKNVCFFIQFIGYDIYNKNALNSQHFSVCISITLMSSTLVMVHPIVSGVWLVPLGLGPTLYLSQARHKYLNIF